ncbi:MAG: immR 1 [Oscillospiraceae bacterium]|nr:immR 1 [Oscillospiraceae bacterium]
MSFPPLSATIESRGEIMKDSTAGIIIRQARLACGMTQKQLAKRLGISDKAVSKWERGTGLPDVSLLLSLAEILDIDLRALLACYEKSGKAQE